MKQNLLIVGGGIYAVVAAEIAADMQCFDRIDFIDADKKTTPHGVQVIGHTEELELLSTAYTHAIVAIGNPAVRMALLRQIHEKTTCAVATLISPRAYVSPSAQVMSGSIIEPMAAVHSMAVISEGCIISAGAVVNHAAICSAGVHVDCHATVAGYVTVPVGHTIACGQVYNVGNGDPHPPMPIHGQTYSFDEIM